MSYNKYTKYQIMDAKYNKNLVNEELLVRKLPLRAEDPRPPKWFQEFEKRDNERWDRQEKINLMIVQRIDKLENEPPKWFKEFAEKQEQFNHTIINRLDKLETEVKGINTRIDNLVKLNNLKEQTTIGN